MTAAPPWVLRTATVTVTLPQAPAVGVTLPMTQVITVAWPRTRTTQAREPGRLSVTVLPARPQITGRGRVRFWSPPPLALAPG
jgi:hypothetical protein